MVAIGIVFGFKRVVGAIVQYLTAGYCGQFVGVTLPLWSLIVEDALYACMAVLFAVGLHRKAWVTLPIIAALIVADPHIKDVMTEYRLFQTSIAFFTGNLVYIFHDQVKRIHWFLPAAIVGASLLGRLDFLGHAAFPVLIGSVIALAITLPQISWRIPDLSYGIYIWHAPIMLALLGPFAMARATPWIVVTSVLSFVAAMLSWYLVEKRALRHKDGPPAWLRWRRQNTLRLTN
jgi:peptidoglycan/LPS O-acetylase OafA/YrhL